MEYQELVDYMNTVNNFTLHNGIVCTELRDGFASAEVTLTQSAMNPQGIVHGGLIFTLCDVAAGLAAASGGRWMLTLNSTISFLRPGSGGRLRCEARRVKEGRSTGVCDAEVYDDGGRLVAKASFTVFFSGGEISLPPPGDNGMVIDMGGFRDE